MADPAFRDNPWSAEHWNLTQQGAYVRKYGVDVARTKAREAGTKFGATRPAAAIGPYSPIPKGRNFTVIVQHKGAGISVGGGGLIGAGSSGDGAP
jgi:hypothetical protein